MIINMLKMCTGDAGPEQSLVLSLTRNDPQTVLVLTNMYNDMGAIMSQFMTKIMFTSCCLQYWSQLLMILHTIRLIQ